MKIKIEKNDGKKIETLSFVQIAKSDGFYRINSHYDNNLFLSTNGLVLWINPHYNLPIKADNSWKKFEFIKIINQKITLEFDTNED